MNLKNRITGLTTIKDNLVTELSQLKVKITNQMYKSDKRVFELKFQIECLTESINEAVAMQQMGMNLDGIIKGEIPKQLDLFQ